MSLVVVGSMAYDAIETPFGKVDRILGGAATYGAMAASYFVRPVKTISVVGNDFEQSIIEMLERMGLDLTGVQRKTDQKSFFWSGKYLNDMNTRETLVTELNVLGEFDPIVPDSYQDCEYLFLGNLLPAVQLKVIERLQRRPKLIALDTMNFWIENTWDELQEVIRKIDILIINDEEARMMTKDYSLVKAARKIMEMGPDYLIIKKGEHGALLFYQNEIFSAPGLPLEDVFDPTGAGDTFAGGFVGYLAKKGEVSFKTMKQAVIYGSALASFCVEKFGPEQLESLDPSEIGTRVDQFVQLADFQITPREVIDYLDQSA